jgi:hypothetical protein
MAECDLAEERRKEAEREDARRHKERLGREREQSQTVITPVEAQWEKERKRIPAITIPTQRPTTREPLRMTRAVKTEIRRQWRSGEMEDSNDPDVIWTRRREERYRRTYESRKKRNRNRNACASTSRKNRSVREKRNKDKYTSKKDGNA